MGTISTLLQTSLNTLLLYVHLWVWDEFRIVVFRPAYKRAGQLMRVVVYVFNPMFVDVYGGQE